MAGPGVAPVTRVSAGPERPPAAEPAPALENGDRLTRCEFERNGVQEYVVWRTHERQIDWFELADGEYRLLALDDAGIVRSLVFPGLRFAAGALLNGDLAGALAEVQKGIGSQEHAAFVARLAATRSSA